MQSSVRTVGILGFGVDGQAVSAWLKTRDHVQTILIFDDNADPGEFQKGESLEEVDLLFRSPGFPLTHPLIADAEKRGIAITSSTIEVLRDFPGITVGVTGSNGKTTCTALIEEFLKKQYGEDRVERGGNDGVPRVDLIGASLGTHGTVIPSSSERSEERTKGQGRATRDDMFLVLELSSFQLMDSPVSPNVAVVLNISPNHLDWHSDMQEYAEAKRQIVAHQKGGDTAILNPDDSLVKTFAEGIASSVHWFEEVDAENIKCKTHPDTLKAAVTAARALKVSEENIAAVLQEFPGVPHRLEFIRELNGVSFYNDSSCTTPESVITACEMFPEGSLTILLGGRDKGMDFAKLYEVIKEREVTVVPYGEMAEEFQKHISDSQLSIPHSPFSFEEAIHTAYKTERPNVALSPACASFDMFQNAKERGKQFSAVVQAL